MTRRGLHRTRADYEGAAAARLAEQDLTLDPVVFQSIWLLHESAVRSRRALPNAGLRERRLTWTQFEALLHVWLFGPARMGEVAAAASISNPTLTDVVAVLEGRGYLTKVPCRTDRRATLLATTAQGSAVAAAVLPAFTDGINADFGRGVDPGEPAALESFGTERLPEVESASNENRPAATEFPAGAGPL